MADIFISCSRDDQTTARRFAEAFEREGLSVWWDQTQRSDPRFKDILRDLKLVDYFRASGNWGDFCKPMGREDFECH